jgi:hypothetical protein
LEKAKTEKERMASSRTRLLRRPGYVLVCNLKGLGHIYQRTFIDTYAKVDFTKLYDRKTPIAAAGPLNDRVGPFFEDFCGNP